MKFTLSWLKDHLETDASLEQISETLTMIGLEVEEITDPAAALKDFKVAHVVKAEPHPDADKLKICTVDTGAEQVQVICGAPNARTGMKGIFAPAGTYVPGIDLTLKKAKIRGVESNGMLCSERELEVSDEHTGIIDLAEDAPIGTPYAEIAGLDDPVIEIAITPNRPDCLGVYGIARDLAAAGLGKLKDGAVRPVEGRFDSPIAIDLKFDEATANACPAFGGRYVRGIKNGPSPAWMQRRLKAIGLRPINALVDITNYLTFDRGRPLHVYDADKIQGVIHARLATGDDPKFTALDGKEYQPGPEDCVIADDSGPLGFGGVIGGESTGSQEDTVNVLIESAYFDPIRTANTGRRQGIESDARYRFERGIDPDFVMPGLELATQMVVELCGGEPAHNVLAGSPPEPATVIDFDTSEVKRLTGAELDDVEVRHILKKLGFWVTGRGSEIKVAAPGWRPDINESACLVEEVIRIAGMDRMPSEPLARLHAVAEPVLTGQQMRARWARRSLAARGMVEAVTWSFIPREQARLFGGGGDDLEIVNPISSEMSSMRPSLLPGLITAAQRNADRGFADLALFEVGQVYSGERPDDQIIAASGVRRGTAKLTGSGRHWSGAATEVDVFDARADAMSALAAAGAPADNLQVAAEAPEWYHPGRSGVLRLGPKTILAYFGELHPRTLKALGASGPMVAFEVFPDAIPARRSKGKGAPLDLHDLQTVRRDFAFVVDDAVKAGELIRAAKGADRELITDVRLFDVFTGGALGEGKKSLAIEVTLQPKLKTLTDAEIDAVAAKVVKQVRKTTGGTLRG